MPIRGSVLIFILDDNEMSSETIGILLQENGYLNCKVFTTPEALLKEISLEVRICIIDYRLDHALNGLDVIEKIKETNPACYFIMITGLRSYEIVERFCNTVNRGRFLNKGEKDFPKRLLQFVEEIIEDIKIMNLFYNRNDELKKSIEDMKTLIKK